MPCHFSHSTSFFTVLKLLKIKPKHSNTVVILFASWIYFTASEIYYNEIDTRIEDMINKLPHGRSTN